MLENLRIHEKIRPTISGHIFMKILIRFAKEYGVYNNFYKKIVLRDKETFSYYDIFCELWAIIRDFSKPALSSEEASIVCLRLLENLIKSKNKLISTIGKHLLTNEFMFLMERKMFLITKAKTLPACDKKMLIYCFLNRIKTNELQQYDYIKTHLAKEYVECLEKCIEVLESQLPTS